MHGTGGGEREPLEQRSFERTQKELVSGTGA
jgi:hypothetical protein